MAQLLVDLAELDLTRDVISDKELRDMLPHAHEFRLIDGICHLDLETGIVVGYKKWDANPWWARGHIPGRPLMPGVLMCEGAAQVATVLMKKREGWGVDRFIGLGGLDGVRFRGTVVPPATVYFVSKIGNRSSRIAKYPAQCYCGGRMVMDMELLGVLL
jgi:3-hydroxyacyl-[acyl-carrier-protein] dehydratase